MPYIRPEERAKLDAAVDALREYLQPDAPSGVLNYAITRLLAPPKVDYFEIMTAIGTLECAKLELYRRVAAPYEDRKCEENGDVYPVKGTTQQCGERRHTSGGDPAGVCKRPWHGPATPHNFT